MCPKSPKFSQIDFLSSSRCTPPPFTLIQGKSSPISSIFLYEFVLNLSYLNIFVHKLKFLKLGHRFRFCWLELHFVERFSCSMHGFCYFGGLNVGSWVDFGFS